MKKISNENAADFVRIGEKVQIRRRGKHGIYVAEFFDHDQHRRKSLKTARLDIARQRAIALEADLEGDEYRPKPKRLSLIAAKEDFIMTKRGEGLKPKSIIKYEQWLCDFVTFASERNVRYLQQCNETTFENFRAEKRKSQSPKSLHVGLMIVKQFFNFFSGGSRDVLPVNPARRCKLKLPYIPPPFTPTLAQVNAILDAATGDRKLHFATAAFSGIREMELAMLSPQSVDHAGNWIKVEARNGWTPKNHEARQIPIHPRLAAMLREVSSKPRPYYFCAAPSIEYPAGNHHLNVRQLNEDIQRIAKSLGIPVGRKNNGLVFHSLRRFFETECTDSGVPQFLVDAWRGQKGQRSMGRHYYGMSDAKSQEFMTKVNF